MMMHSKQFILFILVSFFSSSLTVPVRINFEKCSYRGFTCPVSTIFSPRLDIVFECNNVTTQDVQFYLWQFNCPTNVATFTIQKCDRVQISFVCTGDYKPIQSFKIQNVGVLEIIPAVPTVQNPAEIIFENISYIEKIPTNTFSQVKYAINKAGCPIPQNDTNSIYFKDINIDTIQTEAFINLQLMKKYSWSNVSVKRIETRAVNISFEDKGFGELKKSNLEVLEPLAFLIMGDSFSVTNSRIGDIWTSGFNGTIYDFQFTNNSVQNLQSGAFSVLAQNVYIINNVFKKVESGSFRKISPGLLHDSKKSFTSLKFSYLFNNNHLGQMEDGSFRPDIWSYQNVNANLCYSYNTLPCSCEGLSWLKDDINFGPRYSVIKEFNSMLLDPENSNICSFTPCTCFGGKLKELHQNELLGTTTKRMIVFPDDYTTTEHSNKTVKPE